MTDVSSEMGRDPEATCSPAGARHRGIDLATVVVGDAAFPALDGDHDFAVVFADATPALVAWLRERRPCARPAGPVAHRGRSRR